MKKAAFIACIVFGAAAGWAQQSGMDLYLDKCAACHGPDGAGKTARGKKMGVKDVRQTAPKMKADDMMKVVANGKAPDMDAYGKQLSQDQIKAVVDYYRSLAK
jgi:mono/diheme cytochrome c family protein